MPPPVAVAVTLLPLWLQVASASEPSPVALAFVSHLARASDMAVPPSSVAVVLLPDALQRFSARPLFEAVVVDLHLAFALAPEIPPELAVLLPMPPPPTLQSACVPLPVPLEVHLPESAKPLANAPSDAVALEIPPPSVVDSASEPLPVATAGDFEPFLPSASAEHSLPSDPMLVTVPEVETQLAPVGGIFILA